MKPGRKGSFDSIVPIDAKSTRSRPTAPSSLTKAEAATFNELAAVNRHLTQTDAPLLAAFAQAVAKASKLAKAQDVQSWERACRVMLALARSLRLTPQSTTDPQAIGRRRLDDFGRPFDAPWHRPDEDDDDGHDRADN